MTIELSALQQQRRDTAANWTSANPTLLTAEIGYETDTGKFKIGDGSTAWTSLGYLPIPDNNGLIPIDQLLLPAGTAAAPSLAFDANTGIYSPGADQVGISTAGTSRLIIDSSGNVGIGTTNPGANLEIKAASIPAIRLNQADTYYAPIKLAGNDLEIRGSSGTIEFYNGANNGDSSTEKMRIDSSGRVGIGTSAINSYSAIADNLLIAGSSNAGMSIIDSGDSTQSSLYFYGGTTRRHYIEGGSGASGILTIQSNNAVKFNIGTSEQLRLDSSGRLLLNGGTDVRMEFGTTGTTGTNNRNHIRGDGSSLKYNTCSGGLHIFEQNGSEAMRIDSSGRVGIGVAPSTFNGNGDNLVISSSGATGITIDATSSTNSSIHFADGPTGSEAYRGYLVYSHSSDAMLFGTSGTEKMRIDSSGRLLVGTTSAISGSGANDKLQLVNGAGSILSVASSDTTISDGTRIGEIEFWGQPGSTWGNFATISCFGDATAGSNDNPGRLVFSTTADSASSPTERMRIGATGRVNIFASDGNVCFVRSSAGAGTTDYAFGVAHTATNTSNGTISFAVFTNGNTVNSNDSYGAISDIKLKENIVDAGSQWDDFKAVRFRKYNFKEETGHETFTQLGVIAQELETICPGLVDEIPDRDEEGNDLGTTTKSVKYSILTKKALIALQEAMERIETLEAEVAALKAQ